MKISHIDVISIPVSDQDTAKEFYTQKLGFELLSDTQVNEQIRWLHVSPAPDAQTTISLVNWFEKMPPGSSQGMILATPDIELTRAELVDRGVEVGEINQMPWGKFAPFSDPDGNGWELREE